ncbi:MAG: dihydropteroate synthase [Neomegalonema sp.]|nr:dihydropteroate synthase [Neomegalonema sp.]
MSERIYIRPILRPTASPRLGGAAFLGGPGCVEAVEVLRRPAAAPSPMSSDIALLAHADGEAEALGLRRALGDQAAEAALRALAKVASAPPAVAGVALDRPRIMGVLNVTPDSFSDGGMHYAMQDCVSRARAMAAAGVDFFDIGGESTRPGAEFVPADVEMARVLPAITALREAGMAPPISIDTRKPDVARAAFAAGARIWNDVSSLGYAADGLETAAALTAGPDGGWICLMHAQGDPSNMQDAPSYDNALLDVYDLLARRLEQAVAAGAPADRVILDPGVGFGKTLEHNLAIFRGLALYATLGAPLLIGASRKRFVGALSGESLPTRRAPGSIAAALWSAGQGARILRVHDVEETAQALSVWSALVSNELIDGANS